MAGYYAQKYKVSHKIKITCYGMKTDNDSEPMNLQWGIIVPSCLAAVIYHAVVQELEDLKNGHWVVSLLTKMQTEEDKAPRWNPLLTSSSESKNENQA